MGIRGPSRLTAVLGVIAVAGGASVLSSASAGDERDAARTVLGKAKGLTYVVGQKTISNNDPALVLDCPQRTAVTGGGTFIDTESANAYIDNSAPQPAGDPSVEPDEGWYSKGTLGLGKDSRTMLTYAICSDDPKELVYRSKVKLVDTASQSTVKTRCPRGTAIAGGGVFTDSPLGYMIVFASRPAIPGDGLGSRGGWVATAHNEDNSKKHSLRSYAICSKEQNKYSLKTDGIPIPTVPPHNASLVVDCPGNRVVSVGGAEVRGTDNRWMPVSSPQPAGDPNQTPKEGWIAEGHSNENRTLSVYAICKK